MTTRPKSRKEAAPARRSPAKSSVRAPAAVTPAPRTARAASLAVDWIPALAEPYLRGYLPQGEPGQREQTASGRKSPLVGYRFLAPLSPEALSVTRSGKGRPIEVGFFAGYLLGEGGQFSFLRPEPPECLIFCFVEPVGSPLHTLLVSEPDSLTRRTAEYIRWLTHRPPRFEFFPDQTPALVRHVSMRAWPRAKYRHYSRNFFIETLAWLVRSALVRRLPVQMMEAQEVSAPDSLHPQVLPISRGSGRN